jgi:hypothetical protein
LFSQFWAVCKGIFDFILEKLSEDIKLREKKKLEPLAACQDFFVQNFFTRNSGNFSYERFVF